MGFRVVSVFLEVLRGTIANVGPAARMAWPWLLLLVPLQVAVNLNTLRDGSTADGASYGPLILSTAYWLVTLLAGASFAVNYHRLLLLEEETGDRLRLDRLMWRYLGNGLLIMIPFFLLLMVFLVPVMIVSGVFHTSEDTRAPDLSVSLGMSLSMIIPMAVLQCLSLKLPAIAIGRDDYSFADGWRDARGYFVQIIGFTVLTSVLAAPAGILISLWMPDVQSNLGAALLHALLSAAWTMFMTLFAITTLTVFYAVLAEGAEV